MQPGAGRRPTRWAVSLLALVALTWVLLLAAAPVVAARPPSERASLAVAAFYQAAGQVCHQRVARSFALQGVPLPVCGRCHALYVAGALGVGLVAGRTWWSARPLDTLTRPAWAPARWTPEAAWLALGALPLAATLLWEAWAGDPGNVVRGIGSAPLGLVAGWVAGRGLAAGGVGPAS